MNMDDLYHTISELEEYTEELEEEIAILKAEVKRERKSYYDCVEVINKSSYLLRKSEIDNNYINKVISILEK